MITVLQTMAQLDHGVTTGLVDSIHVVALVGIIVVSWEVVQISRARKLLERTAIGAAKQTLRIVALV